MRIQTPATRAKNSTSVAKRRTLNLVAEDLNLLNFAKENQGSLYIERLETGSFILKFSSSKTGRNAFAIGKTLRRAQKRLISLFHQKYAA